jgi:hypothetical protein
VEALDEVDAVIAEPRNGRVRRAGSFTIPGDAFIDGRRAALPVMSRGRWWAVVAVLVVTVAVLVAAVLWWGAGNLEQVSWVAGVLGLAATVVITVIGRRRGPEPSSPAGTRPGRRWDRPPVRSGVGAALGLGAIGVALVAGMVLAALMILAR